MKTRTIGNFWYFPSVFRNFLEGNHDSRSPVGLPPHVLRVVDAKLPRVPRLEDFGTEKLAIVGRNKHGNGWSVPTARPDSYSSPKPKRSPLRYP